MVSSKYRTPHSLMFGEMCFYIRVYKTCVRRFPLDRTTSSWFALSLRTVARSRHSRTFFLIFEFSIHFRYTKQSPCRHPTSPVLLETLPHCRVCLSLPKSTIDFNWKVCYCIHHVCSLHKIDSIFKYLLIKI